jgi:hypothetical protein
MSTPSSRFDTVSADAGTILADIKGAFGDLATTIHDRVDAAKPEVISALQHLELALHLIAGVQETHEQAPAAPADPGTTPVEDNPNQAEHEPGEAEPTDADEEFAPKQ